MPENVYKNFYDQQYMGGYADRVKPDEHVFYPRLCTYIRKYEVNKKRWKCLEIGSGRGCFQYLLDDYTGLDYSDNVASYYHKPFYAASATDMPFDDSSFDFVFSYGAWEHIQEPEKAFCETIRIIKDGGHLVLKPAWHCRPWKAQGYQVRPFSDFNIAGKMYKAIIPILDFLPIRIISIIPQRLFCCAAFIKNKEKMRFIYKKLKPNYEVFWQSDSDACNNMDPFMVIMWFESRGHVCCSHKTFWQKFSVRKGDIDILIRKNEE